MKSALLLFIIFLLSFSAWAMTPLTDSELSDVTGQAGVSIFFDVAMNIHFDVLAWGDSDGLGSTVTNLIINNHYIGPRMDASLDDGSYPTIIDGAKIISHTVDDYYIRMGLSFFQNPLMPWNTRLY
jgi:hypothetical protein